jgi:hypothetical protein
MVAAIYLQRFLKKLEAKRPGRILSGTLERTPASFREIASGQSMGTLGADGGASDHRPRNRPRNDISQQFLITFFANAIVLK